MDVIVLPAPRLQRLPALSSPTPCQATLHLGFAVVLLGAALSIIGVLRFPTWISRTCRTRARE
jgi:hypothetical protein